MRVKWNNQWPMDDNEKYLGLSSFCDTIAEVEYYRNLIIYNK